jgi:hypothetical protein
VIFPKMLGRAVLVGFKESDTLGAAKFGTATAAVEFDFGTGGRDR